MALGGTWEGAVARVQPMSASVNPRSAERAAEPRVVDARLELPFDQYQRYQVTVGAARRLQGRARLARARGRRWSGPARVVPPGLRAVRQRHLRRARTGGSSSPTASTLPFADETFAVGRHARHAGARAAVDPGAVPLRAAAGQRGPRRAQRAVRHPDLELAEEALNEFIRARFQGDFPTLDEHADNGLPELDADRSRRSARPASRSRRCRAGTCPHWLIGMLVHHELLATGLPHLGKLHAYYNPVVSPLRLPRAVVPPRHRRRARPRPPPRSSRSSTRCGPRRRRARGRPRSTRSPGAILAQRLNAVARTEVLGRELDEIRGLAEVRMREVADRDAHIFELERRLAGHAAARRRT